MSAQSTLLEHHSMLVRDGRILDVLPTALAAARYSATAVLQRNSHLLMPGMINVRSAAAALLGRGANIGAAAARASPDFARDGTVAAIAEMLKAGITCFCDRQDFPEETARAAGEQGMRAVLGMPVAEDATPWARDAAQSFTRALQLRDKYQGDPLISTAFAPPGAHRVSDETLVKLATLGDELDAVILIDLHQSAQEIDACIAAQGMRPIERLWKLGLLTPALNAAHMVHLSAADLNLVQRTGISVAACPQAALMQSGCIGPLGALSAAGVRLAIGSATAATLARDLWADLKLLGALTSPWDALRAATVGGAAALGLDGETGALEAGKWADLCCVDLSGPAMLPAGDPLAQLVFAGGRDIVSDVWVAGRQLVSGGELTRLDWPAVAARSAAWAARLDLGGPARPGMRG